jgi:hypothetical protein
MDDSPNLAGLRLKSFAGHPGFEKSHRSNFQLAVPGDHRSPGQGFGPARGLEPSGPLVAQVLRRGDGPEHIPGLRPAEPLGRPAGAEGTGGSSADTCSGLGTPESTISFRPGDTPPASRSRDRRRTRGCRITCRASRSPPTGRQILHSRVALPIEPTRQAMGEILGVVRQVWGRLL